jgi:hypothetical protein
MVDAFSDGPPLPVDMNHAVGNPEVLNGLSSVRPLTFATIRLT